MARRHHVLVVDDHPDSAEMLSTFLRLRGHETTVAFDGESALAHAARAMPTLAIIDIGLAVMDGFTLATRLRSNFGRRFPILALSAFTAPEFRARASKVGIDAYFTKPVDFLEIEAALQAALR